MLRISTRSRYGVKALFELAQNFGNGPLTMKSISDKHLIPMPFLEQVFNTLKRKGLVKSIRGRGGGYILAVDPSHISVGDVIRALEGPVALCDCLQMQTRGITTLKSRNCVTFDLWKRIGDILENSFDQTTFKNLIEDADRPSPGEFSPVSWGEKIL